jgi:hypothetical protein
MNAAPRPHRMRAILPALLLLGVLSTEAAAEVFMSLPTSAVPAVAQGAELLLGTMVKNPRTALTVLPGAVEIDGTVAPQTSGAMLPPTVRLILRHKNAGLVVLRTVTCDLTIQGTGAIPRQTCVIPAFGVAAGERVELSLQPMNANMPASFATVRARYQVMGILAPF